MTALFRLMRRVGALALLALVLGLAWIQLAEPLRARSEAAEAQFSHNMRMVDRLSRQIAGGDELEAEIAALTSKIAQSGLYVRAETEALAGAAVQERLERLLGADGGELRSVQSLPSAEEDGLTRVGIRVIMTGSYETFVRVLHAVETGEPALFVESLEINRVARRLAASTDKTSDRMTMMFELVGYLPPGAEG